MIMKKVVLIWICLLLCSMASSKATEGDFAPLKLGNLWVYQGTYSAGGHGMPFQKGSVIRNIRVIGKDDSQDSAVFTVEIKDSLYTRLLYLDPLNDTVIITRRTVAERKNISSGLTMEPQGGFGVHDGGMLMDCFTRHAYEDSLVSEENWNGSVRKKITQISFNEGFTLVKDVGLVAFWEQTTVDLVTNYQYKLIGFGDSTISIWRDEKNIAEKKRIVEPLKNIKKLDILGRISKYGITFQERNK